MTETSKSYRIRTNIGQESNNDYLTVSADLIQDYDTFEVLSVDIKSKDAYQLHNSNYGVVVGRVLANNGFGIPNAKISVFIASNAENGVDIENIYPFNTSIGKDKNGVRYNLLPNDRVNGCHQVVGTFPTKRYVLDNDVILEVFDDYYTYTTKTNNAGDYMICGVPTGSHTIHMDLDLSDCGILSQKPRDFVYKGYTIEQFESPTKFKGGTDYNNLSQIFTQDQVVNVNPFWGNSDLGETIGISRCDINVNFKFEPTCIFIGSIVSDNASNGFSKNCIPTDEMGNMDELVTGEGKIEMIRKTPGGSIEEFSIKGNKLINSNGVWCYQIPMNLDYMVTDEYGNMVPTDNPEKGIPTRASVRFRISMEDSEENNENFFRAKVLVPNNPKDENEIDYEFGSYTKDSSFRDLFWNNVYSIKSFIPRIQKHVNYRKNKFSGIKHCNKFGQNNPMPYNNIRIKMPLMFTIMCALIKAYIFIVSIVNTVTVWCFGVLGWIVDNVSFPFGMPLIGKLARLMCNLRLIVLKDGICPDLENWYFAPSNNKDNAYTFSGWTTREAVKTAFAQSYAGEEDEDSLSCRPFPYGMKLYKCNTINGQCIINYDKPVTTYYDIANDNINECLVWEVNILERTLGSMHEEDFEQDDVLSIDGTNDENIVSGNSESICITKKTDYLISCVEMNLAQEYNVINFDFYNDWINGVIYNPRWVKLNKKKVRFLWITWAKERVKGCMDDTKVFSKQRYYVQQCAIGYEKNEIDGHYLMTKVKSPINTIGATHVNSTADADEAAKYQIISSNNFHKKKGFKLQRVFGNNGGICHEGKTLIGQKVYYLKPCEFKNSIVEGENASVKTNLYANDIVLLGTFNECDLNGVPITFTHLVGTSYVMPTNLALTNMDTNGPLYAKDNGTICIGDNSESGITQDRIKEINQTSTNKNGPLKDEIEYYLNSGNYDINLKEIFVDNSSESDTIALTEAAGIAWNYTGPGQGEIIEQRMYYPGGHFLGISCVNSQTNIKSCINLSRICEIGTNLSQRKENVREVGRDGFKYTYSVPTGFISGNDIVDSDFRSMFATLNKKRLIADKRNKKTGYRFYDFEFVNPINFDGSFNEIVNGDYLHGKDIYKYRRPYNEQVNVIEENLSDFGILKGEYRDDYDAEETENTQTRTQEYSSLDYYLFRFGLTHEESKNLTTVAKKFLYNDNENKYYLPQYENSYYFYFGLKQGATALDEFNKQFYSVCDNIKIEKTPNLILSSEINLCNAFGYIHIITEGLSVPYQNVKIENKETGDIWEINYTSTDNQSELEILNMESFYYPEGDEPLCFNFGEYIVTVVDDDDIEVNETIKLGIDLFKYSSSIVNFNKPVYYGLSGNRDIYQGGFVFVEDAELAYESNENIEFYFGLYLDGNPVSTHEYINDFGYVAYGYKPYVYYDLCVVWKCDGGEWNVMKLEKIVFSDNRDIDLRIGYDDIYSISCLGEDFLGKMSESFWFDTSYNISDENHENDAIRWFFREMLFKNSNVSEFNSHVYASPGCKKVLWGVPQYNGNSQSEMSINGYNHIYCSERYLEIPSGQYLDDRRTKNPTYGAKYCYNEDRSLSFDENNCTFQYCAQAYKNSDVGGIYEGTYDRDNGISITQNYFHEGYGCIFKPLPYGKLVFMEYKDANSLKSEIDSKTNAKFGVIYPTFIYPVMKRPFYGDFSVRIYDMAMVNVDDDNGDVSYSTSFDEYLSNSILGIHNGVTFNKKFANINVMGHDVSLNVESSDTYNISLSTNVDRIFECNVYKYTPDILDGVFKNNVMFVAEEGYPSSGDCGYDASLLHKIIYINNNYKFYDKLLYRVSGDTNASDEKIFTVFGEGDSDSDIKYYIGCYDKNTTDIQFLEEYGDYTEKKYAYKRISDSYYIVLCRFFEDSRIHETKWYTDVYVKIGFSSSPNGDDLHIRYEYVDIYGNNNVFDEYVLLCEGYNFVRESYPYKINELLNFISEGCCFEVSTSTINPGSYEYVVMPFYPVMNYNVRNGSDDPGGYQPIIAYGTSYFGPDFKRFMQKLISKGKLKPTEHCNTLPVGQINDKIVFGIGVKTILSNENNEIMSYVYKVYQNPIRDRFFSEIGDYSLVIEPNFYIDSTEYVFGKGSAYKDITINVNSYPCTVILTLEGNGEWCYFDFSSSSYYDIKEINYGGSNIQIRLWLASNNGNDNRQCTLKIQSYYGGIRDTEVIPILQKGRQNSPNATIKVTQSYPNQISESAFNLHEAYTYSLRIEGEYEHPEKYDKYVKIRPIGNGAIKDNPYIPVFENNDYIPVEITINPNQAFEKTITVNDVNDIRLHVPFIMYNNSEVLDSDSDYNAEIIYEYF